MIHLQSMLPMSLCLSRVTERHTILYFADQKHKFFLEQRCNRPCAKEGDTICVSCSTKTNSTIQFCRRFNHGLVHEPLTDRSHMFGSNWYEDGVRRYGPPSDSDIAMAIEYQKKARSIIHTEPDKEAKVSSPSPSMEPVKHTRKPKVAPKVKELPVELPVEVVTEVKNEVIAEVAKKTPVKRPRKPKAVTPIKMADPTMVQKEVVLPTHMEQEREMIDIDGFDIEYVKLSVFTLGDNTYFRDAKKNKLYKKIKEKTIGAYVGRYDPLSETIHTDVPDSDDESM